MKNVKIAKALLLIFAFVIFSSNVKLDSTLTYSNINENTKIMEDGDEILWR